jgi:hypothetical protein
MQERLKSFLAKGDTPARRKEFVLDAFRLYVDTINAATRNGCWIFTGEKSLPPRASPGRPKRERHNIKRIVA